MNVFKLMGMLGNLSKLQEEIQAASAELGALEYVGKAGGEMVAVTVNGAQQLVNCSIDPQLIEDRDRDLIEELVVSAANVALAEAKARTAELLQQRLGEKFDLPGLGGLMGNLMPK